MRALLYALFGAAVLATVASGSYAGSADSAGGPARGTPAPGAWFLYALDGERRVRIEYLGRAKRQHLVVRTFFGGRADGDVDLHLAPQSLLGCTAWPPQTGQSGACRVARRVGAHDRLIDVAYRIADGGRLAVPAGVFDVLRIEVRVTAAGSRTLARPSREVWWYAPQLNWPVRYSFGARGKAAVLVDYGTATDHGAATDHGPGPAQGGAAGDRHRVPASDSAPLGDARPEAGG